MRGTIKSTDELSTLFKTAQKYTSTNLIVLLGEPDVRICLRGRLAFVAGKRLGSALKRNRAKRLMREAAHQLKAPWDGRDVVFVARDKTVTATLDAVVRDMEHLLQRMNNKKS
jgi:ribonuclease P protein component